MKKHIKLTLGAVTLVLIITYILVSANRPYIVDIGSIDHLKTKFDESIGRYDKVCSVHEYESVMKVFTGLSSSRSLYLNEGTAAIVFGNEYPELLLVVNRHEIDINDNRCLNAKQASLVSHSNAGTTYVKIK